MKLSLAANLVLNRVRPVLFITERLQPITAAAMCTVTTNVLAPRLVHLILSLRISYPDLIKFHDFAHNSQEGDEASNEGCNSGPTRHDFTDNSINDYEKFVLRLTLCSH
jgi:hypothetical protein